MPLFPLRSTLERNGKRGQMEAADPPGAELEKKKKNTRAQRPYVPSIIPLFPPRSVPSPLCVPTSLRARKLLTRLATSNSDPAVRETGEGVDGLPVCCVF